MKKWEKILVVIGIVILIIVFGFLMGFNKSFIKFRTQIYLSKYKSNFTIVNVGEFDEREIGGQQGLSLTLYDKKNDIDFTVSYKKGTFGYYEILNDTYKLYKGEKENESKLKDIIKDYANNYAIYLNTIDGEGTLNYFIYVSSENIKIEDFKNKMKEIAKTQEIKMRCTVVVIETDKEFKEYSDNNLFSNYGLTSNNKYEVRALVVSPGNYDKLIHSYSYSIADDTTLNYGLTKIGE